eukprot:351086-Chlamydomonas_euryale.AAC.4
MSEVIRACECVGGGGHVCACGFLRVHGPPLIPATPTHQYSAMLQAAASTTRGASPSHVSCAAAAVIEVTITLLLLQSGLCLFSACHTSHYSSSTRQQLGAASCHLLIMSVRCHVNRH